MMTLLAQSDWPNLLAARWQMAFTLGFHIILACFGVGLPILMLAAEWRYLATKDGGWKALAKRWSKAFAVLFAIGAVSGTVLSFELGVLWPKFSETFGAVIGLPFTMEGFAFFLEAIFVGIYLYSWDKLPPRVHWWTGVPVAVSGMMSAVFVVTANAFMNAPTGFRMEQGRAVDIDPLAAMLNEASLSQVIHMVLAAYMVTGFCVAGFYAVSLLRGNDTLYVRRAFATAMVLCVTVTPLQMAAGDFSAKMVARTQPLKLAAMEAHYETETHAPLRIGGIPNDETEETKYSIAIPGMLSWISYGDTAAEVKGLKEWPREDRPPTPVVHFAFQAMVGIGTGCMLIVVWASIAWLRTRQLPTSRWFLWSVAASGPGSVIALEAGWIVTEVGRQPWIVQGYMRTSEAVTDAPGIWFVFFATLAIYVLLGLSAVIVLRLLANVPLPKNPDGAVSETPVADASDEEVSHGT